MIKKKIFTSMLVVFILFLYSAAPISAAETRPEPHVSIDAIVVNLETGEKIPLDIVLEENSISVPASRSLNGSKTSTLTAISYFTDPTPTDSNSTLVTPYASIGKNESDGGYGMTGYLTINYDTTTNGVKLTNINGSWVVKDSSYRLSNRNAYAGANGYIANSNKRMNKSLDKYPTGNSFTYNTGWTDYLGTNYKNNIAGANSSITITRGGSTWKLFINIKLVG